MKPDEQLRHDSTSLNLLGQAMAVMLQRFLFGNGEVMKTMLHNHAEQTRKLKEQIKVQNELINCLTSHGRLLPFDARVLELTAQAQAMASKQEALFTRESDAAEKQLHEKYHQEMINICAVLDIYGYLLKQEGRHLSALVDIVWLEAVEKALLSTVQFTELRQTLIDAALEVGLPLSVVQEQKPQEVRVNSEHISSF